MAGHDRKDGPDVSQREQTDESLSVEREKTDARIARKESASQAQADQVVRVARQVGIAPAEQKNVFERFRQLSKDWRGLGLGLHISKSIVEAHGGKLWVESKPGSGSTFSFALPQPRSG